MNKDTLGDRAKKYEAVSRHKLTERMPVIIRCDGKAFHSYLRGCKRPFDENVVSCMNDTAKYLCQHIQGAKLAYVQSDEISILLTNYQDTNSQSWFDNDISKMCSVSAGMASAYFTSISNRIFGQIKMAVFDARVFTVPREDVCNAILWRQQDCLRNSVQMVARYFFSHKECDHKNNTQLRAMIATNGVDWYDNLPVNLKQGRCIIKHQSDKAASNPKTGEAITALRSEWVVDNNIPIFSQDRDYIEKLIYPPEYYDVE
jgi:tRNA(His) guanylyltransferase